MSNSGYVLPFHTGPGSPISAPSFRLREKYLILVGLTVLAIICYSTFVFLPSEEGLDPLRRLQIQNRVREALNRPEQLVIPAPVWYQNGSVVVDQNRHDLEHGMDPHRQRDAEALKQKIDEAQIPRPQVRVS